jgi:hypothetical protein
VVQTDGYRLVVDVGGARPVRVLDRAGRRELAWLEGVWAIEDGTRYASASLRPQPHLHPLRSGPYLVELHLENVLLRAGGEAWPGLAEVSLFCHADRVYIVAAFIRPEGEWVNRGLCVYRAPADHRESPPLTPSTCGLGLGFAGRSAMWGEAGLTVRGSPALAIRGTVPEDADITLGEKMVSMALTPTDIPWQPGSARDVGAVVIVADDERDAEVALAAEAGPLPASAFEARMGEVIGFDPARGVYGIRAQTSGTPEPPRGLQTGAHYTVRNDGKPRRLLLDQRDPWGGISGGIIRDGLGEPLPIVVQFGLNFPEHHRDAGEPGWATLTYPLELGANETREIRAEHLYHALFDREIIYLTSLENIGNPLLLQTTVGRGESHTLTTGPYPGKLKPGNELRVNDFRRIYSQLRVRSVSAILPTFFGYWDSDGDYQGLMPGFVSFRETSPFLTEYTVDATTRDGAVKGTLRVWQAAHEDMTRIFTEVSLRVTKPIRLSTDRPAPLFFLRHHAFNPMAFKRFAYTAADGSTRTGELTYERTIVESGAPLGPHPFACIYRADNPIDQGIPCSDITGNSGFVLLEWDVRSGGRKVKPGLYAFCTGAGDEEDGAYARDIAVVPTERVSEIPAGSRVHYRAVQMVYGDNSSDYGPMEVERERWALDPLRLSAKVGKVVSSDPPEIRAKNGRIEATIGGGTDWLSVRVRGFEAGKPLHVRQTDSSGTRDLGPGDPDEPWYNAWPAAGGKCGFTFLVKTGAEGGAVRIEVGQSPMPRCGTRKR